MPFDEGGSGQGPVNPHTRRNEAAPAFTRFMPGPDGEGPIGPRARRSEILDNGELPNPDGTSPVTPHSREL